MQRSLATEPLPLLAQRQSNSDPAGAVVSIGTTVFVVIVALTLISRWMIRICRPNEMLVVTGSKSNQGGQGVKGYRVVANGGCTFVKPILETARRMDVTLLPVLVEVSNAYSKGGTPLNIQAIANVKVSTDPAVRNNAIERFLGRDTKEIVQVAKENLEGNLRSVLAQLTPEQVNEDRLRFAEQIAEEVGEDLRRLGLQLDTLKIQSVFDDVDYLNSISRRRVAQIVRDAEIADLRVDLVRAPRADVQEDLRAGTGGVVLARLVRPRGQRRDARGLQVAGEQHAPSRGVDPDHGGRVVRPAPGAARGCGGRTSA